MEQNWHHDRSHGGLLEILVEKGEMVLRQNLWTVIEQRSRFGALGALRRRTAKPAGIDARSTSDPQFPRATFVGNAKPIFI